MSGLEKDYAGPGDVFIHDTDTPEGSALAEAAGVRGIPTTVFVGADGTVVAKRVGPMPPEELAAEAERLLGQ